MKISLEVTSGGFVTEREPFIFSVAVSDQIEAEPYFLPHCVCWEGGRGAAGVRSSSFRGQRTALWDRDLNTDEITGKAPSYCFRTSYILPAFRSQVLPVTELIFLTSDMVSSIRKTNKRVDHKGPELTGVVMLWFAGQTVLSLSSMEGEWPKCSSLLSHADLPQVVQYKLGPLELGLCKLVASLCPQKAF